MDPLSRLRALTGDDQVVENESRSEPFTKAAHVYEGTDSEDDEMVVSRSTEKNIQQYIQPVGAQTSAEEAPSDFKEYAWLQAGERAAEGESFCPFQVLKKYPYMYIGVANRQKVAETFFDQGKFLNHTWDLFYIHRSPSDTTQQPIILVPTKQFEHFLGVINRKLNTRLTIPTGGVNGAFETTFQMDGTPWPRYLGRSTNRNMLEQLKNDAPPAYYRPSGEEETASPDAQALAAFRHKIDFIAQVQKGKKLANKEKQKAERIAKQQSWSHSIKRVQRYLGLREISRGHHALIKDGLMKTGLEWAGYNAAANAAASLLPPGAAFLPDQPAPFSQEDDVVFICIDVEAYERDSNKITEIGIATLDTRDIAPINPGERGANWMKAIRARHFRIWDYMHLNNTEFVEGCAEKFEFGVSEFIKLRDAPEIVASCFKHPFSAPIGFAAPAAADLPKRSIVLVGHDVMADVNFLRTIGYNVYNLSTLKEQVDTASMWRYLKRDPNSRNLGTILAELGIIGWNLHNAGNDAVYTLQAMIAISVKHLADRDTNKLNKEANLKARILESVQEATNNAFDKEQGWSSGEDTDGGDAVKPLAPHPPKGKKVVTSPVKRVVTSQPWGESKPEKYNRYASEGQYDNWGNDVPFAGGKSEGQMGNSSSAATGEWRYSQGNSSQKW